MQALAEENDDLRSRLDALTLKNEIQFSRIAELELELKVNRAWTWVCSVWMCVWTSVRHMFMGHVPFLVSICEGAMDQWQAMPYRHVDACAYRKEFAYGVKL